MTRVERLTGDALEAALPGVARLRIAVFRAFPYLYDGDAAYEERYLQVYRESEAAILVGAWDGERLVGAATGTPMEDHAEDFGAAMAGSLACRSRGYSIVPRAFCCRSIAGRGSGTGFSMRARRTRAPLAGRIARSAGWCGRRDHPARPEGYRPLDAFWRGRGYAPVEGAVARFCWKEVGQAAESEHALQFWMRAL